MCRARLPWWSAARRLRHDLEHITHGRPPGKLAASLTALLAGGVHGDRARRS